MGTLLERFGTWALVTGASSGIGAEFARQLGTAGFNLVICARREDRLEELRAEIQSNNKVEVRIAAVDLSCNASELIESTADLEISLFVNNAGFGAKGKMLDISAEEQLRMVRLNCVTVVELAHHYLSKMRARARGAMIITASTGAFQALPNSATYGATKAFDLHLGEALAHEFRGTGVSVLTLCPGATDTEGPPSTGVDPAKVKAMSSADVVAPALRQLGKRDLVIPGAGNRWVARVVKMLPRRWSSGMAGNIMERVTRQ